MRSCGVLHQLHSLRVSMRKKTGKHLPHDSVELYSRGSSDICLKTSNHIHFSYENFTSGACVCVCARPSACATAHVWKSKDSIQEFVISFPLRSWWLNSSCQTHRACTFTHWAIFLVCWMISNSKSWCLLTFKINCTGCLEFTYGKCVECTRTM